MKLIYETVVSLHTFCYFGISYFLTSYVHFTLCLCPIDRLSLSWAIIKFKTLPPGQPGNNFSELNWEPSLSLDWLYLSFHWSECDENFREDPSKVHDHIQMKIKMPKPSQEPSMSSKALNKDFKDMDVLWTFKIKIESQNSEFGCIKYHWLYAN